MMSLRRTCKEVSALVIAREDHPLPWQDRLALRLHMAICGPCPVFERQIFTLRHAMKQWRHYEEKEAPPDDSGA